MAYIEAHQSLRDHRKVLALAAELDMPEPHVAGHCLYLWLWGLDNAEDGVLPSSVRIIERAAGWQGSPGALVTGMVNAGMLDRGEDGTLHIHGWWEYAGRFVEKRRQNAERMRSARASGSRNPEDARAVNVQSTCDERAWATVPNPTLADLSPEIPDGISAPLASAGTVAVEAAAPLLSPPCPPPSRSEGDAVVAPAADGSGGAVSESEGKPPKLRPIYGDDSVPMQLARTLGAGIHRNKPDAKLPRTDAQWQSWAREFDLMLRVDHRPREKIEAVIAYAMRSSFWRRVIFSAGKVREKFDVIDAQRQEDTNGNRGQTRVHGAGRGAGGSAAGSGGGAQQRPAISSRAYYEAAARRMGQGGGGEDRECGSEPESECEGAGSRAAVGG